MQESSFVYKSNHIAFQSRNLTNPAIFYLPPFLKQATQSCLAILQFSLLLLLPSLFNVFLEHLAMSILIAPNPERSVLKTSAKRGVETMPAAPNQARFV